MRTKAQPKRQGQHTFYLARLEVGMHDPRVSTLRKLAKALGVPVADLLG